MSAESLRQFFSTLKWADFNVKPRAASLQILPHAELLFGKMWLFWSEGQLANNVSTMLYRAI